MFVKDSQEEENSDRIEEANGETFPFNKVIETGAQSGIGNGTKSKRTNQDPMRQEGEPFLLIGEESTDQWFFIAHFFRPRRSCALVKCPTLNAEAMDNSPAKTIAAAISANFRALSGP